MKPGKQIGQEIYRKLKRQLNESGSHLLHSTPDMAKQKCESMHKRQRNAVICREMRASREEVFALANSGQVPVALFGDGGKFQRHP